MKAALEQGYSPANLYAIKRTGKTAARSLTMAKPANFRFSVSSGLHPTRCPWRQICTPNHG